MIIETEKLSRAEAFALLSTSFVPRPVGWTSTLSRDGIPNLAPFSYTTVASTIPPMIVQAIEPAADGGAKDTLANILNTGEFVVHVPLHDQLHQVQATGTPVEPGVDEFDAAGIECVPSTIVKPPRVASAPIAFECTLYNYFTPGLETLVIGRIVLAHVRSDLLPDGLGAGIPLGQLDALARVGVGFARLSDFETSSVRIGSGPR